MSLLLARTDYRATQGIIIEGAVKSPNWTTLWVESKVYLGKFKQPRLSLGGRENRNRQGTSLPVSSGYVKACKPEQP